MLGSGSLTSMARSTDHAQERTDAGAARAESTPDEVAHERREADAAAWTAHLGGRHYALTTDSSWKGNRIVLRIDGDVVKESMRRITGWGIAHRRSQLSRVVTRDRTWHRL